MYSIRVDGSIVETNHSYGGWSSPKNGYHIKEDQTELIVMNARVSPILMFGFPLNRDATLLLQMRQGREDLSVYGEAEVFVRDISQSQTASMANLRVVKPVTFWEDMIREASKIREQRLQKEIETQLSKKPIKPCLKISEEKKVTKQPRRKKKNELECLLEKANLVSEPRIRRQTKRFGHNG